MTGTPRFYVCTRHYERELGERYVEATVAYSAVEAVGVLWAHGPGGSVSAARPPVTEDEWHAVADYVGRLRVPDVPTLVTAAGPLKGRLADALRARGSAQLADALEGVP